MTRRPYTKDKMPVYDSAKRHTREPDILTDSRFPEPLNRSGFKFILAVADMYTQKRVPEKIRRASVNGNRQTCEEYAQFLKLVASHSDRVPENAKPKIITLYYYLPEELRAEIDYKFKRKN